VAELAATHTDVHYHRANDKGRLSASIIMIISWCQKWWIALHVNFEANLVYTDQDKQTSFTTTLYSESGPVCLSAPFSHYGIANLLCTFSVRSLSPVYSLLNCQTTPACLKHYWKTFKLTRYIRAYTKYIKVCTIMSQSMHNQNVA
jgi:hypothetical protein